MFLPSFQNTVSPPNSQTKPWKKHFPPKLTTNLDGHSLQQLIAGALIINLRGLKWKQFIRKFNIYNLLFLRHIRTQY